MLPATPDPSLPDIDVLLVFEPASAPPGTPAWWRLLKRIMHPDIGHCLAVFQDPLTMAWVIVNPRLGGLQVLTLPATLTVHEVVAQYAGTAFRVVLGVPRTSYPLRTRGLVTCVSVVKALLGIHGWALTPYQLYRQLGGVAVSGRRRTGRGRGSQAGSGGREGQAGRAQGPANRGEAPAR